MPDVDATLARLVEIYSKRLQIQERLTAQIANTLDKVLEPRGGHDWETWAPITRDILSRVDAR